MPGPTKAELLAENRKFARRIALLERAKKKSAIESQELKRLRAEHHAAELRQAATDEILRVISSSPADTQPVFEAVLDGATRLCDAHLGVFNLYDGECFRTVALRGGRPEFAKWVVGRGRFKLFPASMHRLIEE